jgi:hypothetical protein
MCQDVFGSWRHVWPCMKYRYITYPLGAMYPQFKTNDLNIKRQWLWHTMACPSERVTLHYITLHYRTINRYIVVVVVVTSSKPAEISTASYCCYKNNYWIRIITSVKEPNYFCFRCDISFTHKHSPMKDKSPLHNNLTKHDDSTLNSVHYQNQTPTATRFKGLQLITTI